jgi:hypothetical protein
MHQMMAQQAMHDAVQKALRACVEYNPILPLSVKVDEVSSDDHVLFCDITQQLKPDDEIVKKPAPIDKVFLCEYCNASYATKASLSRHVRSKCLKDCCELTCAYCRVKFICYQNLMDHTCASGSCAEGTILADMVASARRESENKLAEKQLKRESDLIRQNATLTQQLQEAQKRYEQQRAKWNRRKVELKRKLETARECNTKLIFQLSASNGEKTHTKRKKTHVLATQVMTLNKTSEVVTLNNKNSNSPEAMESSETESDKEH